MIDDATLAEWEQECRENWMGTVTERLLAALQEIRWLREDQQDWRKGVALIASALGYKDADLSCVGIADVALNLRAEEDTVDPECRRLLDEALTKSGQWYEYGRARLKENADWCEQYSVLEDALTAHQAVVRELVILVEESEVPQMANEGDLIAWVERLNRVLAHSLVVAARREGRDE